MHSPAVQHLWNVQRLVTREDKPRERIPVMTSFRLGIGVGLEAERVLAVEEPEMGDVCRIGKQHGIPAGFEIRLPESLLREFVFVSKRQRRIVSGVQRVRGDTYAVGREQV